MKILIIGGTKFLGRHLIDAAVQNGHEVTLFNRGKKYSDEEIPECRTNSRRPQFRSGKIERENLGCGD